MGGHGKRRRNIAPNTGPAGRGLGVKCNDFKTKLAKCRDPAMRARTLLVEAMAALPLVHGGMVRPCSHDILDAWHLDRRC